MDKRLQEILVNECKEVLSEDLIKRIVTNVNNKYIQKIQSKNMKDVKGVELNLDDIISNELHNFDNGNNTVIQCINKYDISIYTDGACSGNGKSHAIAGFGIYINKFIDGKKYKFYKKISNVMFAYNKKDNSKNDPDMFIKYMASNIRGEGYAILYSLLIIKYQLIDKVDILNNLNNYLLDENNIYPSDKYDFLYINNNVINSKHYNVIINTDSIWWINAITKWMKNWIKNNKVLCNERKNIDLVIYIYYTYNILKQNNINVIFNHVKGHPESKKKQRKDFTDSEEGIYIADKLAVKAKENINLNFNICTDNNI